MKKLIFILSLLIGTSAFAADDSVLRWCGEVRAATKKLKWDLEPCNGLEWTFSGTSVHGRPLVYEEFGDPRAQNTTVIFAMVHGDEITPLYLGIRMAHWMKEHEKEFPNTHVIVAPMVNPDGFFNRPRHRTNAHGVDINRNFNTSDWKEMALKAWKGKFRSDPRRFPGSTARSEPETVFQEELIRKFRPTKILSIHAPLNFMDYDGPTYLSLARFPGQYVRECLKLRNRLKATSSGFFPGSLGNFAGQEMGIPTLTLELPTADALQAQSYWNQFSKGITVTIQYVVPPTATGPVTQQ